MLALLILNGGTEILSRSETDKENIVKSKALSVASLSLMSCVAFANPSVTIYGALDLGILTQSSISGSPAGYVPSIVNKGSLTSLKDGGIGQSYWGIKAEEDLGNDLKAIVNLRGDIDATKGIAGGPNSSGSTSLFNQEANVGLAGAFGSVNVGRVISPIYYAFASTDVRNGSYFGSSLTGVVGMNSATGTFIGNNSNAAIGSVYNDNAIVYSSPELYGITASLEYAFGEVAGKFNAARQMAGTITYADDKLKLHALYYTGNDNGVQTLNGDNTNRLMSVGAMYTLSGLSVSVGYWKGENPTAPGTGVNPSTLGGTPTTGKVKMLNFGLGYRFSPQFKLTSGVYRVQDENNNTNKSTLYVVGADYAVSKRTTLYAEAASVNNQGSNMNQSPMYGEPVTAGILTRAATVGVRHHF